MPLESADSLKPDPLYDEVGGVIVAALTSLIDDDIATAQELIDEVKKAHADEAVDWLFGMVLGLMSLIGEAADVSWEYMIGEIGKRLALAREGIDPDGEDVE